MKLGSHDWNTKGESNFNEIFFIHGINISTTAESLLLLFRISNKSSINCSLQKSKLSLKTCDISITTFEKRKSKLHPKIFSMFSNFTDNNAGNEGELITDDAEIDNVINNLKAYNLWDLKFEFK